MGLFEKIFGPRPRQVPVQGDYRMLTGYSPVFVNYDGQLYENELIRAAINANATHISKLKVEMTGRGSEYLARRLKQPNAFQTWSQFLYRLATIYYSDNTAFICPVLDRMGRVTELYAVLPDRCKVVQVNDEPWLAFEFRDGHIIQEPVWRVGIMRRFQYKNDIFGENNDALDLTLQLATIQSQGITEAVKSAASYRFMAQMSNLARPSDIDKTRDDFNTQNFGKKKGGLILFPSTFNNVQQVSQKPYVVDAEQIRVIQDNVFSYFGVNMDVLQGKAYGDSWTAYYEGTVESWAIQFSEVLTRLLILNGELTGDAQVTATANRLQYMSNAEKLNVTAQLTDRGVLNRDEAREIWNLAPIPDGSGQEYVIRGEYKNAADQTTGGGNENNEEEDDINAGQA